MKIASSIKVGLLTIIALFILVGTINWLKGRSVSQGERIEVSFEDVSGLRAGAAVQIMGLRVGQIEEITPIINGADSYIKVKFVITEPTVTIPYASTISIQQSGIIGEKFLEITPPKIKTVYFSKQNDTISLKKGSKVQIFWNDEYITVGEVKDVDTIDVRSLSEYEKFELQTPYAYKVDFMIDKVGVVLPFELQTEIKNGNLILIAKNDSSIYVSNLNNKYTVVEPIRISDFIDVQFEAAKSFNSINAKINTLLTDEVIADLQKTLVNLQKVSSSANATFDNANMLIESSRKDINEILNMSVKLTANVTELTNNLNDLIQDEELQTSLKETSHSLKTTSDSINSILADPETKETLKNLNETSKNLSEISQTVNSMTKDEEFKVKVSQTVDNLNSSLANLSKTLEMVNELTPEDKECIKKTIRDTQATAANLRKFSNKLNKRFLLFRLLI